MTSMDLRLRIITIIALDRISIKVTDRDKTIDKLREIEYQQERGAIEAPRII